ncbi:MAG: flavodoxin domain-containing protein [Chloroflexota bacterium]|nr:MAG: flavodoxin [Bellilinea sp.]
METLNWMPKDAILVTYASRSGSTAEVAEVIAYEIGQYCGRVDVAPVQRVRDLRPYWAVILGSPVRYARWLPEAIAFLSAQRATLRLRLMGVFQLCGSLCQDTPQNREAARQAYEEIRRTFPEFRPLEVGLFGGRVGEEILHHKPPLNPNELKPGDWRDWEAIREWGRKMGKILFGMCQPSPPARLPPEKL